MSGILSEQSTVTAFVSLGANLEDAAQALKHAGETLEALEGVRDVVLSRVYLTEPQGFADQPFFHNQVAGLVCGPSVIPETLLEGLLELETALGRVRGPGPRNGPRRIDLDLLLMGREKRTGPTLTLPHPRMLERAFVLAPLAEIAPDLELPQGMSVCQALKRLKYAIRDGIIYQ